MKSILIILALGIVFSVPTDSAEVSGKEKVAAPLRQLSAIRHPVYPNPFKGDVDSLKKEVDVVMNMTDEAILKLLPSRSGIFFVICPTPGCGNPQGSAFDWTPENPSAIRCRFCRKTFPSAECPEKHADRVKAPSGKEMLYPYYLAPNGRKHYFSAGIEYRKKDFFSKKACSLAQLYDLTKEEKYAWKASVILCGIALRYPDFAYKFDFPYRDVKWYDGMPEKLLPQMRTSRWSWWGYSDIPLDLILTYDLIAGSEALAQYAKRENLDLHSDVIDGFFLEACRGTLRNPDKPLFNMSPVLWNNLVTAGRVTGDHTLLAQVRERVDECLKEEFLFDGFWHEPSYSYHQQVTNALLATIANLSDNRAKRKTPDRNFPLLESARRILDRMRYPDGRPFPMGDSWMLSFPKSKPAENRSHLSPAIGYAMLGAGKTQLHLSFTPKNGHHHYDTLGIALFSHGREMLSDMGYTHTKMYQFNLSTPAHNMVSVDFSNHIFKEPRKGRGSIEYMDLANPRVQIVSASAANTQPKLAHNRRTLFLIRHDDGAIYAADFYELGKGARNYDYFLHGDADREEKFSMQDSNGTALRIEPHPIVDPRKLADWKPSAHNQDWTGFHKPYFAYGYMTETGMVRCHGNTPFLRSDFSRPDSTCSIFIPLAGFNPVIFHGRTPSIRKARENNHNIRMFRQFVCLRLSEPSEDPVFTTVIHPHGGIPALKAVERLQRNLLKVSTGDRIDYLFLHQKTPLCLNGRIVSGDYGYLSFDHAGRLINWHLVNAKIEAVADSGRPEIREVLETTGSSSLRFSGNAMSGSVAFVKIANPDTGTAYGYFSQSLQANRLVVKGNLGFRKRREDNTAVMQYYPHTILPGKLHITFFRSTFQ